MTLPSYSYEEVLTKDEIKRAKASLKSSNPNLKDTDLAMALEELAFFGETAMLFQAIMSGELDFQWTREKGLEVQGSNRRKCIVH